MNGTLPHHVQTASAEAVSSCRTFGDEAWSQQGAHLGIQRSAITIHQITPRARGGREVEERERELLHGKRKWDRERKGVHGRRWGARGQAGSGRVGSWVEPDRGPGQKPNARATTNQRKIAN
jgi:hypothetical protein